MARRKKASGSESLVALLMIAVVVVVVFSALVVLARNPALLILLLAGGGGLVAWRFCVRQRRARMLAETRRQEIESYHAMNAREFEEALAYLCCRDGCLEARVTGKAGDLGADVVAITPDGRMLVIQAKRYVTGNSVTGPALQKFGGTCYAVHRADVAAVITTSGFTRQAREYAAAMRIALFDHDALAGWAARNGPPPWLAVPAPLHPIAAPGLEPRGKHSRPTP